jgi:hypothetical protein
VSAPERAESDPITPRLLGFFQDVYDDDGNAVGWEVVAWGLRVPGGCTVTASMESPPRVSLWLTVDDAATALDAHIDTVEPRHVARFWRERG